MSDLKLIPANQNRSGGPWSDDDYDVVLVDTGHIVGRILKEMVWQGNSNSWFWGLSLPYAHYDTRNFGYAESKDAAKLAIITRWRREIKS
jgi:hypothetical protein